MWDIIKPGVRKAFNKVCHDTFIHSLHHSLNRYFINAQIMPESNSIPLFERSGETFMLINIIMGQ